MKLKFEHLYLENFMSFESADIDLSSPGFIFVSGENRNEEDGASSNGSGKSTLFEAIYWCLTGNTIRGSRDVVNKHFEQDGCYVELHFTADNKSIELLRSKGHKTYKTNLTIKVDGKDISGKGIRDSEKVFATTFPELSSDLIGSVIILGQGLPNRFTGNTPSGRKQILEQLTNSDFMIEELKSRLNKRESELKEVHASLALDISNLSGQKTILENQVRSLQQRKNASNKDELQAAYDSKKIELTSITSEIDTMSANISDCKTQLSETYRKILDKKSTISGLENYRGSETNNVEKEYSPKLIQINAEIASLSSYITKALSIEDVCPTCGQKLVGVEKIDCTDEQHKLAEAEILRESINAEKREKVNAIIRSYKEKIDTENSDLIDFQTAYNNLDRQVKLLETNFNTTIQRKAAIEKSLADLDSQIKALSIIDFDTQIVEIENKIAEIDSSLLYTNNELGIISKHQEVIAKFQTFTKRDFRGYLLLQYIEFLNKTSKAYATSLFGSDKILITLDGNNLSISYADKEYESLSGGEKQKVDLLVQFSIREMLQHTLGFSSNILILDEIMDNLDEEGCHKLINFISTSFKDLESIYLISHRKDLDIPYDLTINIVKDETGISRVA